MDGREIAAILYGQGVGMVDNMELWNKVCKTDPNHTKKVNQRGGFTAIDAMYQIENATRVFGPVGIGWGWGFEHIFPGNGTVVIKCTLWHGNKENTVEHFGQKALGSRDREGKERADEDAFKKAGTDGLTKCLSYLGFNADVFLGKFDDNKYVEGLIKEKQNPPEDKKKLAEKFVDDYLTQLKSCKPDDLIALTQKNSAALQKIHANYNDLSEKVNQATEEKRRAA